MDPEPLASWQRRVKSDVTGRARVFGVPLSVVPGYTWLHRLMQPPIENSLDLAEPLAATLSAPRSSLIKYFR